MKNFKTMLQVHSVRILAVTVFFLFSISAMGSPFVELDSWIYPALERLAALGYVHDEFLAMRPWTRTECARFVSEAEEEIQSNRSTPTDVRKLQQELKREFQPELDALAGNSENTVRLESAYTNFTGISGRPLNDSYHFGQTLINNYGRPYQEGFNTWDGVSGYATSGPFSVYLRGEYQQAPSASGNPQQVLQTIASVDHNPLQAPSPFASTTQFRLLDSYASAELAGWDFAFGKQSLWWGPGDGSALLFSDNAEPIYMFRASRIVPLQLPWIFRWLGPMKLDLFFGKLSGNLYPPRPLIHGEKISFKPLRDLELGFSRTVEVGGVGRSLTIGRIWNSYTSVTSDVNETPANDPGKRTGGFDFNYRLPFARNWLTLYADSLSTDDPSPLASPRRAAVSPGIYISHFPMAHRLDLRVEAVYTDAPSSSNKGLYIYWDSFYHDLYTNKGNLIGSWIGREGQGLQASSTYWLNRRSTLQFGYRRAKVSSDFIPDGASLNDGSANLNWWLRPDLSVSGFVQYEKWLAPILAAGPQSNWTSSLSVTFWGESTRW